jgi:phosphatidylserine/phosphatidylglycerophosphate/cardiolipin synthase-like enzyme
MRFHEDKDGVSVHVIAGTYVVQLAMDATPEAKKGLLGFAFHREDKDESEQYWLRGMRTFKSVYPNPPEGALVSTQEHPIQDFLWSDFTAKAGHKYVYTVVPVRGKPKNLEYGTPVVVPVTTESEVGKGPEGTHSVWFNRGLIGSQAYARDFNNKDPHKLKGAERDRAYAWLSRHLFEAMRDFIRKAKDESYSIRAAVYEFSYEPIIAEFADALRRCKDIKIVYDARIKVVKGKKDPNEVKRVALTRSLLKKYKLDPESISTARVATPNAIAHNKFIVLLKDGKAVEVWTGSTNFTESGIFGQSNVGHSIANEGVADAYLKYWERLVKDLEVSELKELNVAADPDIVGFPPPGGVTPIFSPRTKNKAKKTMLDWYASPAMESAKSVMCFTAAFGVNNVFLSLLEVGEKPDDDLRYLFLDKWGIKKELVEKTKKRLGKNWNNIVAVGGYLAGDVLHEYLKDRWKAERSNTLSHNVRYTHTKFMLIDPLGEDPIVISGSANFSDASTVTNDENMLIIQGNKRVADIYLGEFMRLWHHYRFRFIVNAKAEENSTAKANTYEPNYLCEDPSWTENFYKNGTFKYKRRLAFR